ncbi:MAG TPA: ferrochelatase [Geminicoccaceae bacterium]|nr:ferrochelatase [Geminicoccaceae bacterium]
MSEPARADTAAAPHVSQDRDAAIASAAPLPAGHPTIKPQRIGVLLLNLGTPDGTDYWSMRRYLKEFLSDRRVIDVNPLIWKPLLNLVILTTRPARSGKAYAAIWNRERDESPLRTITRAQCAELTEALGRALPGHDLLIDWAMRYGNPSTPSVVRKMVEGGCTRLLLFALYPQYAAATTATAYDQAFQALLEERWQPAVRTAPPYFEQPLYIEALARSIESHLAEQSWRPEVVLASFHGLPKRYLMLGDPYHCQCAKTARLLRERLGWDESRLRLSFQSRFGREEWLRPYTDETVLELARAGVKNLAIVTPGFAADCVETLEEIAIGVRELFLEHGGENFTFVPCLNAAADHIALLAELVRRELSGWV